MSLFALLIDWWWPRVIIAAAGIFGSQQIGSKRCYYTTTRLFAMVLIRQLRTNGAVSSAQKDFVWVGGLNDTQASSCAARRVCWWPSRASRCELLLQRKGEASYTQRTVLEKKSNIIRWKWKNAVSRQGMWEAEMLLMRGWNLSASL